MVRKVIKENAGSSVRKMNSNIILVGIFTLVWAFLFWFKGSESTSNLQHVFVLITFTCFGLSYLHYIKRDTLAAILFVILSNIGLAFVDTGMFVPIFTGADYVYLINLLYAFAFFADGQKKNFYFALIVTVTTFCAVNFTPLTPHILLAHVDLLKSWPAIAIWSISSAFLLFQTFSMLLGFAQLMFERNLEQSDFEILLRNLDDAIYIVDKESKLLRFNNAFILLCNRQFNVPPQEGMIFPPADAAFPMAIRYRHLLTKAFDGGSFTEELVRSNQDKVLYYEYSFYPFLHMNAQVDRVGIICRDITAKKMLDMDMVYARNGMVEMIAHDLKAPLSIIKGVNSDMTDSQHKHFIDKTCSQSIDSIDKLLSFFKYLSVNDRFVYKIEDLAHAVIEKVESMRYAGRLRGQELVIENIDINLYVYVNKAAIARVLDNLIENAIKFSPEPGKILISAQKYNNEGIVKVTDFGLGIPDELQKKIFEKFSLSGKDSAGNASTGLGLFLANSIMKLHGGSITFQSKVNEGSTFILKFPLVEVTPN